MQARPFQKTAKGVQIAVRLTPGASANRILGIQADADGVCRLKAGVTAPPEGGKANAALLKMLAKAWKLPKTSLEVTCGATSRRKIVLISGDPDMVMARLEEWGKTLQ